MDATLVVKINDPLLKEKVTAEHILKAKEFMERIYSDNEIGDDSKVCKLLVRLHKDYLCYQIAQDNYKLKFDDFWHKAENYEYMYKRTLEKLNELGIKSKKRRVTDEN
jgi:hypothetical protein